MIQFPSSEKKERPNDLTSIRYESALLFISKSSKGQEVKEKLRSWVIGKEVLVMLTASPLTKSIPLCSPSILLNGLDSEELSRLLLGLREGKIQTVVSYN